jgi:hypothetical protein
MRKERQEKDGLDESSPYVRKNKKDSIRERKKKGLTLV